MATRKLPRTIVEGGRSNTYKSDVRHTHSQERHAVKSYCARARLDAEIGEAEVDDRRRVPTFGCEKFADRLAPIYRWLEANNGRPWNDVYSDLRRRVDIRTMQGWHYLDHVKKTVIGFGYYFPTLDAHIDDEGCLRYQAYRNRNRGRPKRIRPKQPTWTDKRWHTDARLQRVFRLKITRRVPHFETHTITTLVIGRVVIEHGNGCYWGISTAPEARCLRCTDRFHLNICTHGRWRQTTKLSSSELTLWRDLPEEVKRHVRWQLPQPMRW